MPQQASPPSHAMGAEEEGVEVVVGRMSGSKKKTFEDVPPSSSVDKHLLPIKTIDESEAAHIQESSQSNSPRSQLDFDVMATIDDFNNLKMNHSHNAYEIQRKTQAMRELDSLLGDDVDDDIHIKVTFADEEARESTQSNNNAEDRKAKATKRRRRPVQRKTARRDGEWLFSCGLDDIDEVVEDLLSPLEDVPNFSCRQGDDDSIIDDDGRL